MFCEPCGRERNFARYCMVCGGALISRPKAQIDADLEKVRWLLDEVPTWDESIASTAARRSIAEFYGRQERMLADALGEVSGHPMGSEGPAGFDAVSVDVAAELSDAVPAPTQVPVLAAEQRDVATVAEVTAASHRDETSTPIDVTTPNAAEPVKRVAPPPLLPREVPPVAPPLPPKPRGPSAWQRAWKPFLHESLGWFIGAFLILSGALYLVADAWSDMTSTTRALTVFGLTEAWAVGFAAWAAALARKETTKAASRSLLRIAALVAPLSVLALGPSLSSPITWLALAAGTGVATWLTWRISSALHDARIELTVSVAVTTLGLGLAPVLPSFCGWLVLLPAFCALVAFRRAPKGRAWALIASFAVPVIVLAARLGLAWPDKSHVFAGVCVSAALFAAATLWLRTRGALTIVSMSVLVTAFAASFAAPKPACVLIALLGVWATKRLFSEVDDAHPRRQWWLAGTYAFAYLAWQRIDQLVPPIVWVWWNALKLQLGYEAKPMPASYGSVFQSLFIAVSTLAAAWLLKRHAQHRGAHVWLRSSVVAAIASGALALVGFVDDPRPAMVALPLLLTPMWVAGLALSRRDALLAASVLSVLFVYVVGGWPAGVIAAVLAVVPYLLKPTRENRSRRRWIAATSLMSAAVALLGARGEFTLVTLVLGSLSAIVASRQLPLRLREGRTVSPSKVLMGLAAFSLVLPVLHASDPLVNTVVALVGAALLQLRHGRKWRVIWPALVTLIVIAPLHGVGAFPLGLSWLAGAGALWLLSRSLRRHAVWLQAPALVALVAAFAPAPFPAGLLPSWPVYASLAASGVFVLVASYFSLRNGRDWRTVLVASLSVISALACAPSGDWALLGAAVVVLLATPALVAWLTVPLSLTLVALFIGNNPLGLTALAVVATFIALAEESDFAWNRLLNRSQVAWVASVAAGLLLLAARILGDANVLLQVAMLVLPLAWVRATRTGAVMAASVGLVTFTCAPWVAPLLAVVAARGLQIDAVRSFFGLSSKQSSGESFVFHFVVALCGVVGVVRGDAPVMWAVPLLVIGGPFLAVRVVVASLFWLGAAEQWPMVVGGLATLAALVRHAPMELRRVLGTRPLAFVEATSLIVAIAGAAAIWWLHAPGDTFLAVGAGGVLAVSAVAARFVNGLARKLLTVLACIALGLCVIALPSSLMLGAVVAVAAVLLGMPQLLTASVLAFGLGTRGLNIDLQTALPVALTAGALAIALRFETVRNVITRSWRWLGRATDVNVASCLFWGATLLGGALVVSQDLNVLWLLPVLLLTPNRIESMAALSLSTVAVTTLLPASVGVSVLCAAALTFAVLGSFSSQPVARVWKHAGWMLATVAVGLAGVDLHSPLIPLAWSTLAASIWLLVRENEKAHGWAWGFTSLSLHVVMGFVGTVLSKGDPQALILPWWALSSAGLALVRHLRGGRRSVFVFASLALMELLLAGASLSAPFVREAVVCVVTALVLVGISWRRVVNDDEPKAAWLGQLSLVGGAFAARVLASGSMPGLTDAWVLLVVAAFTSGLAQFLSREGRAQSARALRVGALVMPFVAALFVPWTDWSVASVWLLALSAVGAFTARMGSKRMGSLLSAVSFNVALLFAAVGSGFDSMQLMLVPLGVTLLVLVRVFSSELPADAAVKLRALGMGLLYAAVAWQPLFATSLPALALCVFVCLGGIALGMHWRVRSYVLLGTGALMTTVITTLVRSGLAEPRLGALFLSALGLAVVVMMVVLSTKREELRARFMALQRTMATWSP